ncbi:sugar phosphate isomerase/epimerase family protein [Phyllobacterium sp. SB3]|uniref:sugar phosphate isomerase/epimerase family protein n=1 Tax=Phyllobacterium sp. SB3 TaxID=3156073 RepID=UPI0032AFA2BE
MNTPPKLNFVANTYSYTVNYSALEAIDRLLRIGFSAFELMMYPGHLWPNDLDGGARRRLKQEIKNRGVAIRSFNQPNIDINLAGASPEMRKYSTDIIRSILELAGDLEVPGVVIGPGKINSLMPIPRERVIGYFNQALETLVPLAESVGTRVLVENMPFSFAPDIDSLMTMVDDFGDDRVGVVYDLANGYFMKERPRDAIIRAGKRLDIVHVSDTGLNVCMHDPIGHGTMDYVAIKADLEEVEWTDPIVMEIIAVSDNPDLELQDSIARLGEFGWETVRG